MDEEPDATEEGTSLGADYSVDINAQAIYHNTAAIMLWDRGHQQAGGNRESHRPSPHYQVISLLSTACRMASRRLDCTKRPMPSAVDSVSSVGSIASASTTTRSTSSMTPRPLRQPIPERAAVTHPGANYSAAIDY